MLIQLDLYISYIAYSEFMESVNHSMAIAPLLTSYTKGIVHLDGNLYSPDLQKPG